MGMSPSIVVLLPAHIQRIEIYFYVQVDGVDGAEHYSNVCDPGFVPSSDDLHKVLDVSNDQTTCLRTHLKLLHGMRTISDPTNVCSILQIRTTWAVGM
jgi:hypothetical protein